MSGTRTLIHLLSVATLLLWGGVLGLGAYAATEFTRLARH